MLTNRRPAGTANSFLNQACVNLLGEDRSHVESILGKPFSGPEGSILKNQDYTIYPNDEISFGLYYLSE